MVTLAQAIGGKERIIGGPFGSNLTQRDYCEKGVPVIRGGNMGGNGRWIGGPFAYVSEEKFRLDLAPNAARPGDIIVTQRGTLGQVAIIADDTPHPTYVVSQSQMAVNVDSRLADRDFVYYFLTSPIFTQFIEVATIQTGVPHINLGLLRDVEVDWPGKDDQRRIASILCALDDKIELNRRMNGTLEAMARAIFQDWFVAFGPTRAKMEGRPPYLAPDLWALFPDRLDAEGKPEGWSTQPLSAFMSFRGGSQPPADEFVREPRPGFIRLLQIRDFDTDAHITFVPSSSRLRLVDEDDICIGRYGSGTGEAKDSLGRLCRGLAGAINVALVHVTPAFNCREWLATFIGSGQFRTAISGGSARAVQAGFRQEDLDFLKATRAPNEIHAAFEEIGTLVWVQKKAAARENETLAATRDLLLPRLMSGELRVKDAERAVEAAA